MRTGGVKGCYILRNRGRYCCGKDRITYNNLLNRMIVSAWYMVSEYHLNLGPSDALESLVEYVYKISGLRSNEKQEKVLAYLEQLEDREFRNKKNTLSYHVPYRLQAPFMPSMKGKEWDLSKPKLAERINKEKHLIYYFLSIQGVQSEICVQPEWIEYITQNQEIIKGWIQFNLILYLQRRNPNVPGIANKLYPPQERNLHPTTRRINSKKSNCLPVWDSYFPKLCRVEYQAYRTVWEYEQVYREFDRCLKEHVNSLDIQEKLYSKGLSEEQFSRRLEEIVYPVYHAAQNVGFGSWKMP